MVELHFSLKAIQLLVMDQDNWVFDSLTLVDDLLAKALRRFATCVSVNNNLCKKLVSELRLPIIFDDNLKTDSVFFYSWFSFTKLLLA